jgi:transposase InsO family protein
MADATSPTTGRCYGVARVCHVWEVPRSSFYAARQAGADGTTGKSSPARRGPKPAISDQDLLAAIRADLVRSPWTGEGHRKVWARLRTLDGIQVSRKRVLRLMRQHALLSPHRARTRPEASHERHITTEAPNRYEAIQALGMAVRQQFGHLSADAARGLALRHDHGSTFMADVFQQQIKFWGLAPSYAFVAEPETNGVIERLFRTLKEQAIHGRIFQTIEDVRDAVRAFVARYNAEWLIEKNGYRSPAQMRATWQEESFKHAA